MVAYLLETIGKHAVFVSDSGGDETGDYNLTLTLENP